MGGMYGAWGRIVSVTAIVAVLVALSGGFGTGFLAILPRTVYWVALSVFGAAIGILVVRPAIPGRWFEHRPWVAWSLIALGVALPMSVVVAVAATIINRHAFAPSMILQVFPTTLATTLGMTALAFLVRSRHLVETHAAAAGAAPAKFLERLPLKLHGARLWAVEAEDHYLRLHTSLGQDLILMRLADAVSELEGIEGAQTHRSWWVAREAVTGAERAEGRATLTLVDGAQVPVSRGYARTLREGGWF